MTNTITTSENLPPAQPKNIHSVFHKYRLNSPIKFYSLKYMPCILKNKKHNKITNKASLVLIVVSCWFIVYFSMHEIGLLVNRAKKIF